MASYAASINSCVRINTIGYRVRVDKMMRGMEFGKRLAEKRVRNTADLRKDVRLILEWHIRCIVGRHA